MRGFEARAACHQLVMVPGGARCLNVATAGSIVLYDRAVRGCVAEVMEGTSR